MGGLRAPAVDGILIQYIYVDSIDMLIVALRHLCNAIVILIRDALIKVIETNIDDLFVIRTEWTLPKGRRTLTRKTNDPSLAEARDIRLVD